MSGCLPDRCLHRTALLPVLSLSFFDSIMRDMKGFSERRISRVSGAAVALTTCLFLLVALGSVAVFGSDVPADVLQAFDKDGRLGGRRMKGKGVRGTSEGGERAAAAD